MYKKLYLFVLIAVLTAGFVQAQITLGGRAGLSFTNMSVKYDGKKPDKEDRGKLKPGFQMGVTGEYVLNSEFSVQSGLIFATQGLRYESSGDDWGLTYDTKTKMNISYLQIPINALYQMDMDDLKLVLMAGPYFGFALSGKTQTKGTYDGQPIDSGEKIEFGSKMGQLKRLDFGVGLSIGLQFGDIRAGIGYQFGMMNLSNFDKTSQKNNGLTLSVTYLFGIL